MDFSDCQNFYYKEFTDINVLRVYTSKNCNDGYGENSLKMIVDFIQSKHIKKISFLKLLIQLHVSSARAR